MSKNLIISKPKCHKDIEDGNNTISLDLKISLFAISNWRERSRNVTAQSFHQKSLYIIVILLWSFVKFFYKYSSLNNQINGIVDTVNTNIIDKFVSLRF